MSFHDIDTVWEYSALTNYARTHKPYKTSSDYRYPLGNRKYSSRFFRPRLDDIPIELHKENWFMLADPPPIDIYYGSIYKLGTFYPDNTFEFAPERDKDIRAFYGQGDTGVISSVLPGWIQSKCQYGGSIFTHRQTKNIVPVFHGLKIRLCDGTPVQNYELKVKTLDRKLTRPHRIHFDEKFKIAMTMLKGMGEDATITEMVDINKTSPTLMYAEGDLFKAYAPDDPARAVMTMALRYNINDCAYRITNMRFQNSMPWFRNGMKAEVLVRNVKTHFYDELYHALAREGENIFAVKTYKFGDKLPTMEWGHEILIDGVPCNRVS